MVTRLSFTRETPTGGLTICGTWVPPGLSVGVYAPVIHQSRDIFGEDVKVFRPERWLEDKERATQMNNTLFHFGHGKYSCLGKNIGKLEIVKLIPTVLREFDVSSALLQVSRKFIVTNNHAVLCRRTKQGMDP